MLNFLEFDLPEAEIATPYVSALKVLNIPFVADIMNVVILVAVLSCLNSGVYAASRMLFALTQNLAQVDLALQKMSIFCHLVIGGASCTSLVTRSRGCGVACSRSCGISLH